MTDLGNGRENMARLMKRKTDSLEVGRGREENSSDAVPAKADTVPEHRKAGERQAALGYAPKRNTDSGFGSLTLLIHPIP